MIRAVVDTNVLVSGLISPSSYPRQVFQHWRAGDFVLVTSHAIIQEATRALYSPRIQVKYGLTDSDIQAFVLALRYQSDCVAGELTVNGVAPDPGDDKVISCAVEGKAELIVTGDKALQRLGRHKDIRIISAETFTGILAEGRP